MTIRDRDIIDEIDINVNPDRIIALIGKTCTPDEVFSTSDLEEWALNNGFVKEGEQ